jgi:hypothetical protein
MAGDRQLSLRPRVVYGLLGAVRGPPPGGSRRSWATLRVALSNAIPNHPLLKVACRDSDSAAQLRGGDLPPVDGSAKGGVTKANVLGGLGEAKPGSTD